MKRKLIGPLHRSLKIDYATETHSATEDGQYELHMARAVVKRKKIKGFIIQTLTRKPGTKNTFHKLQVFYADHFLQEIGRNINKILQQQNETL